MMLVLDIPHGYPFIALTCCKVFPLNVTSVNDEQPKKTLSSNLVTVAGIVSVYKLEQLKNKSPPSEVTFLPMYMLVMYSQPKNAPYPMCVTLSGMCAFAIVLLWLGYTAISIV